MIFLYKLVTLIFIAASSVASQGSFPQVERCPDQKAYCSDPAKYPEEQINELVEQSIELKLSPETKERFFGQRRFYLPRPTDPELSVFKPACESRTELLSPFSRMYNLLGEFVYLAQARESRQSVQITYCVHLDSPCRNDLDSPYGEGSTTCVQTYRVEKLLAVSSSKQLVVDSFKLPSGCVCAHKDASLGLKLDRALDKRSADNIPPTCTTDLMRAGLKTFPNSLKPTSSRLKFNLKPISPCNKEEAICEADDDKDYPEHQIKKTLALHVAFGTPAFFDKLFGDVCKEDEVSLRFFEPTVTNLCSTNERYIYPKKAKRGSTWYYIINTENYRQGVLINECSKYTKNEPCRYGGSYGIGLEYNTVCLEVNSLVQLLAIGPDGVLAYVDFSIPTSCSCHIA